MTLLAKSKQSEQPGVPEKILNELRKINHLPEVAAAAELFHRLEGEKKRIVGALHKCSGPGPAGPTVKFDPGKDAAALLDGAPVESLTAPAEETYRGGLLRQLRAIEGALPSAQNRQQETFFDACRTELERIRPILVASYNDVLLAFEALLFELRRHRDLLAAVHKSGIYGLIMQMWDMTPLENQLLFGGDNPSLEKYIETRRATLHLEVKDDGK